MSDARLVDIETTRPTKSVDTDHLSRSGAREIFVGELLGEQLIGEPFVIVHIVVASDFAAYVDPQELGEGVVWIVDGLKVVRC
jgi:hypothetical protein